MVVTRLAGLLKNPSAFRATTNKIAYRNKVTTTSGAFLPEPPIVPFGLIGIVCVVIPGLLVGAMISKNIASFLEENDLFVPSEDDEDD